MDDDKPTLSKTKLLALVVLAAPLATLLYWGISQAAADLNDEDPAGWDWYIAALLGGANLVWLALLACLIWIAGQVPYSRLSAMAVEWWTSVDPNLVWYPWQAVALAAAVGLALLAIGVRGVAADLTNNGEAEGRP